MQAAAAAPSSAAAAEGAPASASESALEALSRKQQAELAGLRETAERLLARRTTVGQLARALAGKGAALADGRAFDVVLAALAPDG